MREMEKSFNEKKLKRKEDLAHTVCAFTYAKALSSFLGMTSTQIFFCFIISEHIYEITNSSSKSRSSPFFLLAPASSSRIRSRGGKGSKNLN